MTRLLTLAAATLAIAGLSAQTPGTPRPDPRNVSLRGDRFKQHKYA